MGNDAKKQAQQNQQSVTTAANSLINSGTSFLPSAGDAANLRNRISGVTDTANANYQSAVASDKQTYGDLMGGYKNLYGQIDTTPSTNFSFDKVSYARPQELTDAFGSLKDAGAGYKDFAATGGYSPQDIQELRARGMSPIQSAYSGAMRDLSRANTLGGGASNYIAARAQAQRNLPQQIADAETGVNAQLAEDIRSGKLQGLAGEAGVGQTMGGLSSDEAGRILSANLANSQGALQAAGMTEQAKQAKYANLFGALSGQAGLYGTTPGQSALFGNQVMQGLGQEGNIFNAQANTGLGMIGEGMTGLTNTANSQLANQGTPWWRKALGAAAAGAATYFSGGALAPAAGAIYSGVSSDRNLKEDITDIDSDTARRGLKKLNLHKWKYKGDDVSHIGPMAQDFKKAFGVGDGKTIHLADVMGVMLAAAKESHA